MLPTQTEFSNAVGKKLGVSDTANVVVYDTVGLFGAPRVWWTLKVFGAQNVSILDGGLPQWRLDGYGTAAGPGVKRSPPAEFNGTFNSDLVATREQVMAAIDDPDVTIIDARSTGRFEGVEPEPRAGCRSGHIPNSINIPFNHLLDDYTGAMKPAHMLKAIFERNGVVFTGDMNQRFITSCGSGVTAAFLSLGLHQLGYKNVALYDGAWSEWGARSDTPVQIGPSTRQEMLSPPPPPVGFFTLSALLFYS
jgi:thiosulfate/3-mercaptopyruvate sulfurtransferase